MGTGNSKAERSIWSQIYYCAKSQEFCINKKNYRFCRFLIACDNILRPLTNHSPLFCLSIYFLWVLTLNAKIKHPNSKIRQQKKPQVIQKWRWCIICQLLPRLPLDLWKYIQKAFLLTNICSNLPRFPKAFHYANVIRKMHLILKGT